MWILTFQNLQKAKKGCIVMTPEIEEIYNSLAVAKVPKMWLRHAYPTLKTLNGFISDLLGRLQYFKVGSDLFDKNLQLIMAHLN